MLILVVVCLVISARLLVVLFKLDKNDYRES